VRPGVADIANLEAQGAQDLCGASRAHAAAEVVVAERSSGCELVGDAENGLGVVAFTVEDQQVGGGGAEMVEVEELIASEPVVLGGCLADVLALNWIPFSHEQIVGHGRSDQRRQIGTAAARGGRAIAFQAMRLDYHKLVRDQIPRIIEAGGGQPVTRVPDQAGYQAALRAKLMEEAEEAQAAPDGQLRSELADVLEVLQALATAHGMSWEDVVAEAARKRDERGGFDQRIFLEYVDQAD
jgi:predicted house-cleaning noncanonical NTP pyrophosphatase (MazG superfamily)